MKKQGITYDPKPNGVKVELDGRFVGVITLNREGYTYWPRGSSRHGEFYPTLEACKRSLETDEEGD